MTKLAQAILGYLPVTRSDEQARGPAVAATKGWRWRYLWLAAGVAVLLGFQLSVIYQILEVVSGGR